MRQQSNVNIFIARKMLGIAIYMGLILLLGKVAYAADNNVLKGIGTLIKNETREHSYIIDILLIITGTVGAAYTKTIAPIGTAIAAVAVFEGVIKILTA